VEVTRLTGEDCSDVEVGFPDVAGNVRWLRISARRLSEGEPPYGVVASFTDVTEQRRMSDEIEDAADRYRAVVEALHEGVVLADAEGRIVGGNHRAEEVLGLSPGQMMGTSTNDPRWRAERPDGTQLTGADHPVTRVCASGMPVLGEVIGIHIGALELRWLHVNAMPLRTRDGSLSGVVATFEDVSGQLAEREALRRATELFSTAFADAPIGMALVGLDGGWLQVNERMCEIVGYSADELRARSFQDITYPDDLDADLALLAETVAGKRQGYQMQKRYVRSDGSLIWVLLSVSLVRDPDGTPLHFVSQVQDVTEQRETDQRLQALADRDELTGLLNRRRFEEELTRQLARTERYAEPAALAVIDLDGFKAVNDSHGHAAGDDVLRDVAAALAARVRGSDLVARLGGDEFAALLLGVDAVEAAEVANALTATVARAGGAAGVTASVGVTSLEPGDAPDQALARADQAMYAAKAAGPGGSQMVPR
jgi:diguanylate cyclase (GGDEF)-like protein/PAS domain S-box-containing protein